DFGTFVELEDLNGDESVIARLFQRRGDGFEINLTEAGALEVPIVRMEMSEVRPRLADDLRDGPVFRTHRLYIQDDLELFRVQFGRELNCFGGGVDEIRCRRRQRFEANCDVAFLRPGDRGRERFLRPITRLLGRNARLHGALFG